MHGRRTPPFGHYYFVPLTRKRHRIYVWRQGRRAGISWEPM
ncbi:hypothetical protein L3Y25_gp048 [Gordonia phage Syleon]|uniref:Uncharacterized protein n=2 Tax=Octobienvirus TaxID=3044779 RepID=A0AAE9C2Y9_9CAUD|nr:hypothetical protein L3Y24_gp047 [Gordonia phage Kudefre]YP_010246707.1 hypothetical protein L3Y25_gp048 [Gordonia phage Syleon]QGH75777.1 hypothetical protein SEA_SYLEON_48 [Gordonia phage Syleon]UDL15363.1 hypothetical protein SEA_KUDEFRE_47 [Gordonia phage Kudefre]